MVRFLVIWQVVSTIIEELGEKLVQQHIAYVESIPLSTASIAQAPLKENATKVPRLTEVPTSVLLTT